MNNENPNLQPSGVNTDPTPTHHGEWEMINGKLVNLKTPEGKAAKEAAEAAAHAATVENAGKKSAQKHRA